MVKLTNEQSEKRRKTNKKQQKLYKFYKNKFIDSSIPTEYSSPHLISLENDNVNTDIMVIGQETNSWYGNYGDFVKNDIDRQMNVYSDFMKEHYENMNNIFFRYIKNIINNNSIVPVWTNLFKYDLGDKSKNRNISKAEKDEYIKIIEFHDGILAKEIEIIQPKIIIFFTGLPYDKLYFDPIVVKDGDYRKLYKKIDKLKEIDEWKCGVLDLKNFDNFDSFKGKAIRTYHPIYLNRKYKEFGEDIIAYIKQEIHKTI